MSCRHTARCTWSLPLLRIRSGVSRALTTLSRCVLVPDAATADGAGVARPGAGSRAACAGADRRRCPRPTDSIKFLVIGDTGTGVASSSIRSASASPRRYKQFPFEFAIMLGDNLYGS